MQLLFPPVVRNDNPVDFTLVERNSGMAVDLGHLTGFNQHLLEKPTILQMRCCYPISHAGFWLILKIVGKVPLGKPEHADMIDDPSVGVRRRHLPI